MDENDPTPTTLLQFYRTQSGENTAFTDKFLDGHNLLRIQTMLTEQLRSSTKNATLPQVQFTEGILSSLMAFAYQYRLAWENEKVMDYANYVFVQQMAEQNEARYYETAFWKRWCEQGIPDPGNIPLALPAERTDFTAETDSYMLGSPIGYKRYPHW
jgi:hypothetical protein